MKIIPTLAAILVLPALGFAQTTWYVPDDFPGGIQAAINGASNGDTIIVRAGIWKENINFKGKAIKLQSQWGPVTTAIMGNQSGCVVRFKNGEGPDSEIRGFLITNGKAGYGGGISCANSSPTIIDNIITGNLAPGYYAYGGGISCISGSSPAIINNTITSNGASFGGGIHCDSSSPLIESNIVSDNTARSGGGIYCKNSSPHITFTTITGNSADFNGGGIYSISQSSPSITNSILWNNSAAVGPEIYDSSGNPTVTYSDVQGGWTGTGNIDADPLFFDPASNDYHLQQDPCQPGVTNPCVDAGDPSSPANDGSTRTDGHPDIGRVDMGYHYEVKYILFVPDEYTRIQDAIDDSWDDFTILVRPGIYVENLDFKGKAITVRSIWGASVTTIDGNQAGSVVTFQSGEGENSVLAGFTITNGSGFDGGGIHCSNSSPTIIDNSIDGNTAGNFGAGIYCYYSSPSIIDNSISGNTSAKDGGGIYCESSSPAVTGNTISGNAAVSGAGIYCNTSSPTVTDNSIDGNTSGDGGGGICCENSAPAISNNIVTGNTADLGGGICCYSSSSPAVTNITIMENTAISNGGGLYCDNSSPTVTNTILWDNTAAAGPEIYVSSGSPTVTYSDVKGGWPGAGNIDADPLFFDPGNGHYHLRQSPCQPGVINPCVDTGDPASALIDASTRTDGYPDTGTIDMGFHYPLRNILYVPDDYASIQDAIDDTDNGFTIFVKPGTYVENIDFKGKAITIRSLSGPEVTTIDGNQAGSAVTFKEGEGQNSVLDGFTISNGKAAFGGAVHCRSGSSPTLINLVISGNLATSYGGAVSCDSSSPTVSGSTISGNFAEVGGAIYCRFGSSPTITGNDISGNHASINGGAVHCYESPAQILNNSIIFNTADNGGGIFLHDSSSTVAGNVIARNTAGGQGGGISCHYSSPLIVNNAVSENSAAQSGGGIYCDSNSSLTITNNTVFGNSAISRGGGIRFKDSSGTIVNTILWENNAPIGAELTVSSSIVSISYSTLQGGLSGTHTNSSATLTQGAGMIIAEPHLVEPDAGDFHIPYLSACKDSGDNAAVPPDILEDFEGDPRIADGAVDMGADEFHGHLYHIGPVVQGSPLSLRVTGPPGSLVILGESSNLFRVPRPTPYGPCYLRPPITWHTLKAIPFYGVFTSQFNVPATWNPGEEHPFQAFLGGIQELTNPITLTVE